MNHGQEDLMFGYQFLNGCNPVMIQRCLKLPDNLPLTTEMVECSLERQLTLEQEVEVGPGLEVGPGRLGTVARARAARMAGSHSVRQKPLPAGPCLLASRPLSPGSGWWSDWLPPVKWPLPFPEHL